MELDLSTAARSEELAEKCGALRASDAAAGREAMIQSRRETLACERRNCAHLRIGSSENERGNAGVDHRSHAHETGLERDIEGRTDEAVVAGASGGAPQSDDFGVGGRIARYDRAVAPAGKEEIIPHDDGSDRDLAPPGCGARQVECAPHPQIGDIGAEHLTPP
jgi:hypothetical protein